MSLKKKAETLSLSLSVSLAPVIAARARPEVQQDNAASGSREGEKKGGGGGEVVRIDLFAAGTELVCGRADIACVTCAQCRRESVHAAVSVCVWLRFGRNDKKKKAKGVRGVLSGRAVNVPGKKFGLKRTL